MSMLEQLALKTLENKKIQIWLTMLIEINGAETPKVLKSFTKIAKTSDVKKVVTPKSTAVKVEKKFSKVNEGVDLF